MAKSFIIKASWRSKEKGFTLLEVLIVVFIISLASTVIIVALPSSEKQTIKHADKLVRELNFANRESVASGVPTALFLTEDGYAFKHFREKEWSKSIRTTKIRNNTRQKHTRFGLILDDEVLTLEELDSRPILTFYPIGDATPASIVIEGEGPTLYVNVTDNANVEISDSVMQ